MLFEVEIISPLETYLKSIVGLLAITVRMMLRHYPVVLIVVELNEKSSSQATVELRLRVRIWDSVRIEKTVRIRSARTPRVNMLERGFPPSNSKNRSIRQYRDS